MMRIMARWISIEPILTLMRDRFQEELVAARLWLAPGLWPPGGARRSALRVSKNLLAQPPPRI